MRTTFDKSKELFVWGPIPGRMYFVTMFEWVIYNRNAYAEFSWPPTLFLFKNKRMVWINQMEDVVKNGIHCFKTYMLKPKARKYMYDAWLLTIDNMKKICANLNNLETLSDADLIFKYWEFYKGFEEFWTHSVPPELANYGSPELLKQKLEKIVPKQSLSKVLTILTAPEKPSFYQVEESELLNTDDLKKHQQQYYWLRNSYAGAKILDIDFFKKRKENIPQNFEEITAKHFEEVKKKKSEVIEKYKIPKSIQKIAKVLTNGIVWQDKRKKHIFQYIHFQNVLAEEFARRSKIPVDDLLSVGFHKVPDVLREKPVIEHSLGIDSQDEERISKKETLKLWDHYISTDPENMQEFKGVVASPGKAKGKVRVLLDPYDEFNEGDILVTAMTSPEFVFAMKKASAIITDTGGLTSHAAIVSRELKKPCIVGTKVATVVLKDGDQVEIKDGTVKKL